PAPAALCTLSLHDALPIFWAVVLIRHGRAVRSPALEADGQHLATDVVSTVGVLVGLGLAAVGRRCGCGCVGVVLAILAGACRVVDRKSTRLNSSHVKISYA